MNKRTISFCAKNRPNKVYLVKKNIVVKNQHLIGPASREHW